MYSKRYAHLQLGIVFLDFAGFLIRKVEGLIKNIKKSKTFNFFLLIAILLVLC